MSLAILMVGVFFLGLIPIIASGGGGAGASTGVSSAPTSNTPSRHWSNWPN